ncbi:MAG: Ribonuclease HII [Fluviibacter phosphoraccumulans EoVTN8]
MQQWVCGVDEAGRGPLVGSVVAAAVILDPARPITGLADSKKLRPAVRERLAIEIREKAIAWCVAEATAQEIDEINILQATMLAMKRAVSGLQVVPAHALIDGNRIPQGLVCSAEAIVKGDAKEPAISAASILAKKARDAQMVELDAIYPQYGFAKHMGYPTPVHLAALKAYGPLASHRRSFGPVAQCALPGVF